MNTVETTTDVTIAGAMPPTIMTKLGNFQSYMQKLWDGAQMDIERRMVEAATAKRELDEMDENLRRLSDQALEVDDNGRQVRLIRGQLKGAKNRLTRATRAVTDATNFRDALAAGYVPLPRMPAVDLRWVDEIMPSDVLDAMQAAGAEGVFDSFRVVNGDDAADGWPRGHSRNGLDPILVGMVGREMFAIAWWR